MTVVVRDVEGDSELHAWVDVRNTSYPWLRLGRDDVLRERETEPRYRLLVAVDGAAVVGCARVVGDDDSPDDCQAGIFVRPDARRRGVGARLAGTVAGIAREWGATHLEGITIEGEAGEAFARSLGLDVDSRLHAVRLDLTERREAVPGGPDGVDRIVTLAARPGLARNAWDVVCEGLGDLPGGAAGLGPSFEEWRSEVFAEGFVRPELCAVALAADDVVGVAVLGVRSGDPTVGIHELTAVRRFARGRGVATALKVAQIAWSREAGLRTLHASNDEENAPMRSINRRLGYRPAPVRLWMRGPLP